MSLTVEQTRETNLYGHDFSPNLWHYYFQYGVKCLFSNHYDCQLNTELSQTTTGGTLQWAYCWTLDNET